MSMLDISINKNSLKVLAKSFREVTSLKHKKFCSTTKSNRISISNIPTSRSHREDEWMILIVEDERLDEKDIIYSNG